MPFFSCPNCKELLNFDDLRTFVAKFFRENLRTFSADFFGLKTKIRRHFYFLDVWGHCVCLCLCVCVCLFLCLCLFVFYIGNLNTSTCMYTVNTYRRVTGAMAELDLEDETDKSVLARLVSKGGCDPRIHGWMWMSIGS